MCHGLCYLLNESAISVQIASIWVFEERDIVGKWNQLWLQNGATNFQQVLVLKFKMGKIELCTFKYQDSQ